MKVDEIVELANKAPGFMSNDDVLDFFKLNNVGHWPSENGMLTLNMTDGNIVFTVENDTITVNQPLKNSGKIWLLSHYFTQVKPQVVHDMAFLSQETSHKSMHSDKFHKIISQRALKSSKIIKSHHHRYAIAERVRENFDESKILTYDIKDLDNDKWSRYAMVVPSLKPRIIVYQEYRGEVVQFFIDVDGKMFEDLQHWERAELIASTPFDKNKASFVSEDIVMASFLFTQVDNTKTKSTLL